MVRPWIKIVTSGLHAGLEPEEAGGARQRAERQSNDAVRSRVLGEQVRPVVRAGTGPDAIVDACVGRDRDSRGLVVRAQCGRRNVGKAFRPAMLRVTFILAEYSLHNEIVERYAAARPDDALAIVKVPLVLRGKGRRETISRIAPRLSRRFLGAKLVEGLFVAGLTRVPKILGKGAVFRRLRGIAAAGRLPFLRTGDIMSREALDFIQAQRPDVVVTLFHQIVRKDLLEVPRFGVINAHPGLLPGFAGIQPYFWALSEGAAESGATLHLIEDESVDTGRILARAAFPLRPGMSAQLVYYLTSRSIARLLPPVIADLAANRLEPRPQEAGGNYFRWPDSAAMDRLKRRGHPVFSLRDMAAVLTGRYDDFEPARVEISRPPREPLATLR